MGSFTAKIIILPPAISTMEFVTFEAKCQLLWQGIHLLMEMEPYFATAAQMLVVQHGSPKW